MRQMKACKDTYCCARAEVDTFQQLHEIFKYFI